MVDALWLDEELFAFDLGLVSDLRIHWSPAKWSASPWVTMDAADGLRLLETGVAETAAA
ncbi:MAG: hypothetical protein KF854_04645 [Nitrospira sp.]|nr:hypothetical protein [Nitrospira sp.]